MATRTYIPLATTTLASSASSVTFSSIDQSYGDLVLVFDGQTTGVVIPRIRFNGATTNYTVVSMQGSGSSTNSNTFTSSGILLGGQMTSDGTGAIRIAYIMDYSATDKHKTVLVRANQIGGSNPGVEADAGRYASTSAITSLAVVDVTSSFEAGSTFSLYGIAK